VNFLNININVVLTVWPKYL